MQPNRSIAFAIAGISVAVFGLSLSFIGISYQLAGNSTNFGPAPILGSILAALGMLVSLLLALSLRE